MVNFQIDPFQLEASPLLELDRLTLSWLKDPGEIKTLFDLALAHQVRSNFAKCIRLYEMVLTLKPQMSQALANQASALKELGYFDWALKRLEVAHQVSPNDCKLINNLGAVLTCLGRHEEAIDCYSRALSADPHFEEALINKGFALSELMRMDEAIEIYNQVLANNPQNLQAQFNLSLLLLLEGRDLEGWTLYESRLHLPKNTQSYAWLDTNIPIWTGIQSLQGCVIWVHCEQGLGDTLQFCRETLKLIELGAEVILSAPVSLIHLLSSLPLSLPRADLALKLTVLSEEEVLRQADYQIALMSIPLALMRLQQTSTHVPWGVPYLFADESKVNDFALKLGPKTSFRVALVWSGGHREDLPASWALNQRRNIPWSALKEFIQETQIEWFSLQLGANALLELKQLNAQEGFVGVKDLSPMINDFSDTAALASLMDLVITVDTSVAHLVGALGQPVWILNRFDACWRWGSKGYKTKWYPSARLFRQGDTRDWTTVAKEVFHVLEILSSHEACTLSSWQGSDLL